jgi:hypothetical protein
MSRIDTIKNGMGHIKRYADTVIAESYLEDVQFLLAKLEQAEQALVQLDRVLMFNKMGETVNPPSDITTGTQMMIWSSHNDRILALNHAKKFAAETLEKLKE